MKTVKCGTVPGVLSEYAIEDNQTVGDVLEMADIDASNRTVMLDGANAENGQVPRDGATITVTQKIKGNA